MDNKKILSIDIGVINLGYVVCEIGDTLKVIECNRVDITHMRHTKVCYKDCRLHHDFCIPDYLDHFIQEYQSLFTNADIILIERQPPMGILTVMDLLFVKFRDKIIIINPGSVHKFFKMTKGDYDLRKIESVYHTNEYLKDFFNFQNNERKHDISDAMLMVIYYFELYKKNKKKQIVVNDFEQFRYTKILTKN